MTLNWFSLRAHKILITHQPASQRRLFHHKLERNFENFRCIERGDLDDGLEIAQ